MKIRMSILPVALFFSLSALWPIPARAGTFNSIYAFMQNNLNDTNSEGSLTNAAGLGPVAGLVVSGNVLYGTAQGGGSAGMGTVFAVNTDGSGFTTLHSFTATTNGANGDGAGPMAGLLLSSNVLYGTADAGGQAGQGTVFSVNTNGTGFTTLHNFTGFPPDGANPMAGLILSGNTLYGTAFFGGNPGSGSVFAVNTDGSNFRTVYNFTGVNDGSGPSAGVVLLASGNTLYGTAGFAGSGSSGTVFAVNTDGSGFMLLHSFSIETNLADPNGDLTNSDGAFPVGGLVLSGNTLYGTTQAAGTLGFGTAFAVNTDGSGFTVLHAFTAANNNGDNSDGQEPDAGLFLSGGTLYGTAGLGGAYDDGTVFSLNTDGSGFTTLTSFPNFPFDGDNPRAGVVLSGSTLYGTTRLGGGTQNGNIFSIALGAVKAPVPQITFEPVSQTNDAGSTVTLFVAATASGALTYQWLFDGVKISGAKSQDLVLKNVTTANTGSYEAIVSNSSGSSTSSVATVTVLQTPTIATPPATQTEPPGGIARFSVKATGAPLTYLWLFDGAPLSDNGIISGSASNQLTINLVTSTNQGNYSVVISNSSGSVTSKVVQLTLGIEKTKPAVTILSPKAGSRTNAPLLSGTASDAVRVQSVKYWVTNLNNGVSTTLSGQATLTTGTGLVSDWTISAALLPGTNILAVQSVNYAGLVSPVESAALFYQVAVPLQLSASPPGAGTVTGVASVKGDPAPANGAKLYVGESYTVTAKPAANWWLTNWQENSSIAGTNTTLTFIMESNLVVTANFATNLFLGMAARYDGIFYLSDALGATEATSGLIENLQLASNGLYSGKLYLAGSTYSLVGAFNRSGQAMETIARSAAAGGGVTLQLTIAWQSAPRQITGSVQGAGWISTSLSLFAATTNTNNFPNYTVLLPQDTNLAGSTPPGYGYALITNTGSMINMGFFLADGSSFSRSEPINEEDQVPVYASLYNGQGLALGRLSLAAGIFGAVPAGGVTWIKPAQPSGLYATGFNTGLGAEGSPWTNSAAAMAALFPNNAQLTISGGGLASAIICTVQLTSSNTLQRVSGSTNFTGGSINPANGLLRVVFRNASGKSVTNSGAVLQNINQGGGFFLGTTNAGTITLTPPPPAND
jgi:uncharacterized repeat protein (TIGR03803 family)